MKGLRRWRRAALLRQGTSSTSMDKSDNIQSSFLDPVCLPLSVMETSTESCTEITAEEDKEIEKEEEKENDGVAPPATKQRRVSYNGEASFVMWRHPDSDIDLPPTA